MERKRSGRRSRRNISAGVVLTPIEDLVVTIDWYSIEVRHRIGISQQFNVTAADIANLSDLAYVGAGGTVQYFTNGFDTKTKGVDLVGTYHFNLGPGRLGPRWPITITRATSQKFDPTVISKARIIDIQHYAPNHRANLNVDYQFGPFAAVLHQNYYGTYRDENDYPGQLFSSKWTTDLDLSYTFWRQHHCRHWR